MIKAEKTKIIETFKTHEGDTGSTEIQVAILTERIKRLTGIWPPANMILTPSVVC